MGDKIRGPLTCVYYEDCPFSTVRERPVQNLVGELFDQHHGDERLAGPRAEVHDGVLAEGGLQQLQLVGSSRYVIGT